MEGQKGTGRKIIIVTSSIWLANASTNITGVMSQLLMWYSRFMYLCGFQDS